MTAGPGRTYRYYNGTPSFPFGFGLSYTTFSLIFAPPSPSSPSTLSPSISLDHLSPKDLLTAQPSLSRSLLVTNTGARSGDQVVFAYLSPRPGILEAISSHRLREAPEDVRAGTRDRVPIRKLVAFQRVHVEPGAVAQVDLSIPLREFAMVDANGVRALFPGEYDVVFGTGSGREEDELGMEVSVTSKAGPLVLSRLVKWW